MDQRYRQVCIAGILLVDFTVIIAQNFPNILNNGFMDGMMPPMGFPPLGPAFNGLPLLPPGPAMYPGFFNGPPFMPQPSFPFRQEVVPPMPDPELFFHPPLLPQMNSPLLNAFGGRMFPKQSLFDPTAFGENLRFSNVDETIEISDNMPGLLNNPFAFARRNLPPPPPPFTFQSEPPPEFTLVNIPNENFDPNLLRAIMQPRYNFPPPTFTTGLDMPLPPPPPPPPRPAFLPNNIPPPLNFERPFFPTNLAPSSSYAPLSTSNKPPLPSWLDTSFTSLPQPALFSSSAPTSLFELHNDTSYLNFKLPSTTGTVAAAAAAAAAAVETFAGASITHNPVASLWGDTATTVPPPVDFTEMRRSLNESTTTTDTATSTEPAVETGRRSEETTSSAPEEAAAAADEPSQDEEKTSTEKPSRRRRSISEYVQPTGHATKYPRREEKHKRIYINGIDDIMIDFDDFLEDAYDDDRAAKTFKKKNVNYIAEDLYEAVSSAWDNSMAPRAVEIILQNNKHVGTEGLLAVKLLLRSLLHMVPLSNDTVGGLITYNQKPQIVHTLSATNSCQLMTFVTGIAESPIHGRNYVDAFKAVLDQITAANMKGRTLIYFITFTTDYLEIDAIYPFLTRLQDEGNLVIVIRIGHLNQDPHAIAELSRNNYFHLESPTAASKLAMALKTRYENPANSWRCPLVQNDFHPSL